jgi:glucokinase
MTGLELTAVLALNAEGVRAAPSPIAQIAVDIGGTKIAVTVTVDRAKPAVVRRSTRTVLRSAPSPEEGMSQLIRDALHAHGLTLEQVGSVVVGIPGVIDRHTGTIASCPNLPELDGRALGRRMSESLGLRVRVENDVNVTAVGEATAGRGQGIADVACILVGSGIGCGLILRGELYVGADGTAGEFGHTIVAADGRPCTCGSRGCLEMYCSGKALAARAEALGLDSAHSSKARGEFHGAEGLIEAARHGDQAARRELDEAFTYLGLGICNLVNIVNPRLVILGGGVMNGWPTAIDRVREIVKAGSRLVARDRVEIEATALGDEAFAIGAARLAAAWRTLDGGS